MSRAQIIEILEQQGRKLKEQFGIKRLSLFGSAARDEMSESSDIDMLVEFEEAPTFDGYMDLKFVLEDLFNAPVDLVTQEAIKPRMRPYIEKDRIDVA